jgi:hypothetical protein
LQWPGWLLASPTCPPNGPSNTKFSAFRSSSAAFEPVSASRGLCCRETEFCGQRQRRRNGRCNPVGRSQRPSTSTQARRFGAFRQKPGNLR